MLVHHIGTYIYVYLLRLYSPRDQWRQRHGRFLLLAAVLQRFVYSGQRLVRRVFLVFAHVPVPVTALRARVRVHLGRRVRGKAQTPAGPSNLILRSRRVLGHHGPRAVGPYPQQTWVQTTRPIVVTCA